MGKRKNPDIVEADHRLVFLGPPGSGKGTQARLLATKRGLSHISTGVILRTEIKAETPIGTEARKYIVTGRLVPDEMIRSLAEDAIKAANFRGFILDGYPRTIQQAQWLHEFLDAQEVSLTAVIQLVLDDEDVVSRLSQRRIHSLTGENFHLSNKPPPKEEAEFIVSRPDDQPDAIRKRLKVYYRETHPLIEYYDSRGLLLPVQALGSFSEVHAQIRSTLQMP
ncbi:MAG: adenylate kinase [Rhodothermaceae bacterium]|nr:adenylate kinase [Rhodothermaceae bacterium]MXW32130.1 adenylate kinase [Rhodothermaceae bacterium]MYC03128.1 adenylate kinase [Rhodothermaceae bacterium]MYE61932.1 adenylate kinase [Rhodothermaceae bacterium]MYI16873.1 adenylate kinase [Rhodothermaceae bacterium]